MIPLVPALAAAPTTLGLDLRPSCFRSYFLRLLLLLLALAFAFAFVLAPACRTETTVRPLSGSPGLPQYRLAFEMISLVAPPPPRASRSAVPSQAPGGS